MAGHEKTMACVTSERRFRYPRTELLLEEAQRALEEDVRGGPIHLEIF
jgi:hypothetical protein